MFWVRFYQESILGSKLFSDINMYITIILLPQDVVYRPQGVETMDFIMVVVAAVVITIPRHQ